MSHRAKISTFTVINPVKHEELLGVLSKMHIEVTLVLYFCIFKIDFLVDSSKISAKCGRIILLE